MSSKPQNLLPRIAERFLNTPLLLDPRKAAALYSVFDLDADSAVPAFEAPRFTGTYARRHGTVALIALEGPLVNRGGWIGTHSGLTTYAGIAAQLDAAQMDPEIEAVIIDIDSPGGEATGMFGIAQKVRHLAAVKPVVAVVNDVCCSAAYGIASGATEIVISPTSLTGSIGVVMVHMDHSAALAKKGVKPTIIQKGAQKTYGHPFGALDTEAFAALDKMMAVLYDQFLETIALGRGDRLTAEAARKTEAGVFVGADAVTAGIADRVAPFDAVLEQLRNPAHTGATTETVTMTPVTNAPAPGASGAATPAPAASYTQAQLDAAVAAAKAEGAKEATARVKAILEHDAAKGREASAMAMALSEDTATMRAETVGKVLATMPKTAPQTKISADIPTPDQRAAGAAELGPDDFAADKGMPAPAADHGWGQVMADINAGR